MSLPLGHHESGQYQPEYAEGWRDATHLENLISHDTNNRRSDEGAGPKLVVVAAHASILGRF